MEWPAKAIRINGTKDITMSTNETISISDESKKILDEFKGENEGYDEAIENLHQAYRKVDLFYRTEMIIAENDEDDWVPLDEV